MGGPSNNKNPGRPMRGPVNHKNIRQSQAWLVKQRVRAVGAGTHARLRRIRRKPGRSFASLRMTRYVDIGLSACPPVRLSACPPVRLSACPPYRLPNPMRVSTSANRPSSRSGSSIGS
jgi:hypothetical protein